MGIAILAGCGYPVTERLEVKPDRMKLRLMSANVHERDPQFIAADICSLRFVGLRWNHACLNRSGVPRTFPHETVFGRARELLALAAHRLWQARIPFAFFEETVERSASQRPTVLVNRFACAR
jgi:hypothetical protein